MKKKNILKWNHFPSDSLFTPNRKESEKKKQMKQKKRIPDVIRAFYEFMRYGA